MKVLSLLIISFIFIVTQSLKSQDIILQENFNGSVTGWTVVDGYSDNKTWFIYDAGSSNLDGTDYVMINSDASGNVNMNEELRTPIVDATGYLSLSLEFDQYFRAYTGNSFNEKGDVDVWDGSQWINVYRVTTTTGAWSNPNHQTLDITSYANANLKVRFHYYDAKYDWYWAVDNIKITGTVPSCPTASFNNIEIASPYNCGDTINLIATGYGTSGEYITPGFNIYLTTDIYSDTENSLTIYKNGEVYYEVPIGSIPENTEWNLWGEYMDPTANWSFEWCDSYTDGTFPYEVYDNMSGQLITSGTINNNTASCQTITIGTLDGISAFVGTGISNNGDGTATLLTSSITPGNYDITFYYNNNINCSDSVTQSVVLQGIIADAGNNQAICSGDTIEIGGSPTASGGNHLSYSWSPNTGLSSNTVANPQCFADTTTIYTLIVTDSICGEDTITVTITVNPKPTSHAGADQTHCIGDNITLGASPAATGGTTPYNYSWTPTTGLSAGNVANPTLVATSSQNYILNISDANNCTSTDNIQLNIYNQLIVNSGEDKNLCQGKSLSIGGNPTASGGTMPYSYNWMPATGLESTNIANPTTSTNTDINYIVEVTDGNGCTASDSVNINVISNQDFVGGTSASYTTSGGRFLDSGGETGNYNNNENYTITFYPCDNTKKIQLVFTSFSIQYHSTCMKDIFKVYDGPNTSSTLLTAVCGTGNIGPFTSSHSSGAITVKFTSDGNTIGSGWVANINQACVINPTIEAGTGQSICNGENIQLGGNPTATGGYGTPYTYNWTPTIGLDNPSVANPTASPDNTTTYTLVVTDKEGCNSLSDMVEVLVSGNNEEYIADSDATYYVSGGSFMDGGGSGAYSNYEDIVTTLMPCGDHKRVKLHFSLIDIETNINCSYDWLKIYDGPDTNSTLKVMLCGYTTSYDVIATNPTGALTFQFHSDNVVNGAGWNSQISLECQPPKADAGANTSTCSIGQQITLGGNPTASSGSEAGYTYNWSPSTGLSSATEPNPTVTINSETHYYLTVTDGNGCVSAQDSIYIYIADTAQEYRATKNGNYYVDKGYFYDSGGSAGDYSYDEESITTLYPCEDFAKVSLTFTDFDLEAQASCNYDWFKIYDGPDTNSTLFGKYCGTDSIGKVTSTHSTGALTVWFYSDFSITGAGWSANIGKETKPLGIITNITKACYTQTGTITAEAYNGAPPYTYNWITGDTTNTISYDTTGTYSLTVTDSWNRPTVFSVNVESETYAPIEWTDIAGVEISGDTIRKTAQTENWDAGAASLNKLIQGMDGFIEYVETNESEAESTRAFGFSDNNFDVSTASIDYGFYFGGNQAAVIESGNIYNNTRHDYKQGDKFRISRKSDTIYYAINDDIIFSSVWDSVSFKTLMVDVSILNNSAYFKGIRASFCFEPIIVEYDVFPLENTINVSTVLNVTGGVAPYTYLWNNEDTNYVLINIPPDNYSVTVTDRMGGQVITPINLLLNVSWTKLENTFIIDEYTLQKNEGTSTWNGSACSFNILSSLQSGYVQYIINESSFIENDTNKRMLGLSVYPDTNLNDIDYAFYFNNNQLEIVEFGLNKGSFGTYSVGDKLVIKRNNSEIIYLKNDTIIYQNTTSFYNSLIVEAKLYNLQSYFNNVKVTFGLPVLQIENNETITVGSGGDYTSISDAVNALNGKQIYDNVIFSIEPGIYNEQIILNSSVQFYKPSNVGIYFINNNIETSDLILAGNGNLLTIENKESIYFAGIKFETNNGSNPIFINNCNNVWIEHSEIKDSISGDTAVIITNSDNININYNNIDGFESGIYMNNGKDLVVSNNKILSSNSPLNIINFDNVSISKNTIEATNQSDKAVLNLFDISKEIVVFDNKIMGNLNGVEINNTVANVVIKSNEIVSTDGYGIFVKSFADRLFIGENSINSETNGVKIKDTIAESDILDTLNKKLVIFHNSINTISDAVNIYNVKNSDILLLNNIITATNTAIVLNNIEYNASYEMKIYGNMATSHNKAVSLLNSTISNEFKSNTFIINGDTNSIVMAIDSSDNSVFCANNMVNVTGDDVVLFAGQTPVEFVTNWNNWYSYTSSTVSNNEGLLMSETDLKVNPGFISDDINNSNYQLSFNSELLDKTTGCLNTILKHDIYENLREDMYDIGAIETISDSTNLANINILLHNGLFIYPDGHPEYETFKITGLENYSSIDISIYKKNSSGVFNNEIYNSTSNTFEWNGIDTNSQQLATEGYYKYEIIVDGNIVTGVLYVKRTS